MALTIIALSITQANDELLDAGQSTLASRESHS
jgi:hypothetical protein